MCEIFLVQSALVAQGYDPGKPDGLMGPKTMLALIAWSAVSGPLWDGGPTRCVPCEHFTPFGQSVHRSLPANADRAWFPASAMSRLALCLLRLTLQGGSRQGAPRFGAGGDGPWGAQIEIAASTSRDEEARVARVVARAAVTDRKGAWALYRLAEIRGLVDLLLVGPVPPGRNSRPFMHLLVCADLFRRSEDLGLSPDPFPQHYS